MSIFTGIEHFLAKLFGKDSTFFQDAISKVASLAQKALPIVAELASVAAAVETGNPGALLATISGWLNKAVKDTTAVETFLVANANVPTPNLLHNAAVLATQHTTGGLQTALKDLDLAVQLAYNAYAAKLATGNPAAVTPGTPPAK